MKKTLIASAIAAATVSSTAFAMDPATQLAERLDSMPTFYGNVQLAYVHTSEEPDGGDEVTTNDFIDNGSTLGIKHSHEIAPGLEGFLKVEWEFDADDKDNAQDGIDDLDEAFIGVKGSFGSVLIGTEDNVYEWVDMLDMYEAVGLAGEINADNEGDQLQYVSPEIAGGLKVGVSLPLTNDGAYTGQIAGMYSADMFEVALAYSMGKEQSDDGVDYGDTIGLAATVNLGDLAVVGQFETKDADEAIVGGAEDDNTAIDTFGLLGIYTMGANQFALGYQMVENDNDGEAGAFYLQALHNLSDNMYVYVEYVNGTAEADDNATTLAFGEVDVAVAADSEVDFEQLAIGATYAF